MADLVPAIDFVEELAKGMTVHTGLKQEILVTTSDKLRLCLIRRQGILDGQSAWLTPLGIFLTLLAALVAADFRAFWGLSKEAWNAIFVVGAIVTCVWLITSIYRKRFVIWSGFTKGTEGTINDIVNEMKVGTTEVTAWITAPKKESAANSSISTQPPTEPR